DPAERQHRANNVGECPGAHRVDDETGFDPRSGDDVEPGQNQAGEPEDPVAHGACPPLGYALLRLPDRRPFLSKSNARAVGPQCPARSGDHTAPSSRKCSGLPPHCGKKGRSLGPGLAALKSTYLMMPISRESSAIWSICSLTKVWNSSPDRSS